MTFAQEITQGIPDSLPKTKKYDLTVNHAPKRKKILSPEETQLALRNALRYFDSKHHASLLPEFSEELESYGRILHAPISSRTYHLRKTLKRLSWSMRPSEGTNAHDPKQFRSCSCTASP